MQKYATLKSLNPVELQLLISQSTRVCQVLRTLGLTNGTGNHRTFWSTVETLGLDASHIVRGRGSPLTSKSKDHKLQLRLSKLAKYGVTLEDCETHERAGNRWCSRHRAFLPQSAFHVGRRGTCRQCERERGFERTHHLPYEWYTTTLQKQNGGCAICRIAPEAGGVLCLDHDHRCCAGEGSCGKCARGLLCKHCNTLVGWLETNRALVETALRYST